LYLGLDLGTSGVTALLLGGALEVRGRCHRDVASFYPQPGWVEQDPYALLEAVRQAGVEVLAGTVPGAVKGVGFANPGESVLAWDARSGEALTKVMVWSDTRSEGVCERLRRQGQEAHITELSGLRLDPYFCASKFAWLLEHDENVRLAQRGGYLRLCSLDAWMSYQLSGKYLTDPSTASRTQLYSPLEGCWSPVLLAHFGVSEGVLPEIRPGLSRLGTLSLGSQRISWTAALLDQVAALAGNGCLSPGEVKVTYGTGAFVLAQAGSAFPTSSSGLVRSVGLSSASERGFILDGGVYSAGSALTWLERLGLLEHASQASGLAEGATGTRLRFLPAFSGLGAPWWQTEARGVLSGLGAESGRAEIVRAVLDGIASSVTDILERVAEALPQLERLRADGGLTQNRYLMQRQADLSGLTLERSLEHEATALGMALLAGVSMGALEWAQVKERTSAVELFFPQMPREERAHERTLWRSWLAQAATLSRD